MEKRLIDADALCEEFKERQRAALRWKEKAILDGDEERQIRADATLAFLSEVKLTIDNAPTVEEIPRFHLGRLIHPRFGEQDCIFDDARHIYYFDSVTKELMAKYDWKFEEADDEKSNM